MANLVVASFSALGSRCWSTDRLAGTCASCDRYDRCTYPERVPDVAYDALRTEAAAAKLRSEELYAQAKKLTRRS